MLVIWEDSSTTGGTNSFSQVAKAVPNLFTMGNLLCGVPSITCNMSGFLEVASILVLFSRVF